MLFSQPGEVVEGGVNTAVMVETVALQRIFLLQVVAIHFPVSEIDGIGEITSPGLSFQVLAILLRRSE